MIKMYFELVINQRRTCNKNTKDVVLVPIDYRQAVLDKLTAEGFDADGHKIV